jgi:hypothetical protein
VPLISVTRAPTTFLRQEAEHFDAVALAEMKVENDFVGRRGIEALLEMRHRHGGADSVAHGFRQSLVPTCS